MLRAIARYNEHKSANELNVRALKKIAKSCSMALPGMHACMWHTYQFRLWFIYSKSGQSLIISFLFFFVSYLTPARPYYLNEHFFWRNIFLIFVLNSFSWPAQVGMLGTCSRVMDRGWKSQNLPHLFLMCLNGRYDGFFQR